MQKRHAALLCHFVLWEDFVIMWPGHWFDRGPPVPHEWSLYYNGEHLQVLYFFEGAQTPSSSIHEFAILCTSSIQYTRQHSCLSYASFLVSGRSGERSKTLHPGNLTRMVLEREFPFYIIWPVLSFCDARWLEYTHRCKSFTSCWQNCDI